MKANDHFTNSIIYILLFFYTMGLGACVSQEVMKKRKIERPKSSAGYTVVDNNHVRLADGIVVEKEWQVRIKL